MMFTIPDTNYSVRIPPTFGCYEFLDILGDGSASIVVLARNLKTKNLCACKILCRQMYIDNGTVMFLEQELRILERVKHPNICKVEKILYYDDIIIVCMEYCINGTLFDYIFSHDTLTDFKIKKIILGIVSALDFLHRNNIAHRDIKLENIILTDNLEPKIIDFGLSSESLPSSKGCLRSTFCGTLEYMAPEIIKHSEYCPTSADMWSLGVAIFIMVTGRFPWYGTPMEISKKIIKLEISFPETVNESMEKIIRSLMSLNPKERPRASELKAKLEKELLGFVSLPTSFSISSGHRIANIIKPFRLRIASKNNTPPIKV